MAQVDDDKNGRSANIELNLVPFIDLMSVLITFLLITAVWSQVSMIQLGSSIHAMKDENKKEPPPPPPPEADFPLRLDVKDFGFRVIAGLEKIEIRRLGRDHNKEGLLARLKKVKAEHPLKIDAVITVDEELPYEELILGMDVLNQVGFPSISISTVEAE
jgi:biopolymer transport protein ExbD